jgi:hypothetical protein
MHVGALHTGTREGSKYAHYFEPKNPDSMKCKMIQGLRSRSLNQSLHFLELWFRVWHGDGRTFIIFKATVDARWVSVHIKLRVSKIFNTVTVQVY